MLRRLFTLPQPKNPEPIRAFWGLVLTYWLVHVLLRVLQLGRPAPYGGVFVEKFDWYFFHAVCYDALWSLPFVLPLLLYFSYRKPQTPPNQFDLGLQVSGIVLGLLTSFCALDHEMMRFLSVHGSLSQFRTYIGVETAMDLPALLSVDAGGVGLPVLTVIGSGIFVGVVGPRVGLRFKRKPIRIQRYLYFALGFLVFSYLFLFHIWKGGFRLAKLQPLPSSLVEELLDGSESQRLSEVERAEHARISQAFWQSRTAQEWRFTAPDAPFFREPLHEACGKDRTDTACARDQDGDGHSADQDCDDLDPRAKPGGVEVASNGVDEDCDGIDLKPWNVVVLMLESHRAINVGHLKAHGGIEDSTPFLDALAQREDARVFTRHHINGVPTIASFFNLQCSTYSKSKGHAATDNTRTRMECLPKLLNRLGYQGRFFTASAPDWDNQTYWLQRWYSEGYAFDRSRQTDRSFFKHMGAWMRDHMSERQPFFVGAITKSNHFPFNAIEDMTKEERAQTPRNIGTTMRYTDSALKTYFETVATAPWFSRTLFVITADHGFNWGEKGFYKLGDPMHRPSSWLPLVIVGAHPELMKLPKVNQFLTSHVDLAPTILDLLGIRTANTFVGHSVLDSSYQKAPYVLMGHGRELTFEVPTHRAMFRQIDSQRHGGDVVCSNTDFHCEEPYEDTARIQSAVDLVHPIQRLTDDVYKRDRVLPVKHPLGDLELHR